MPTENKLIGKIMGSVRSCADGLFSDQLIEFHSNRYVLISGCRKMTEYNENVVKISFGDHEAQITGKRLIPESLINGQMAIRGKIDGVVFSDNKTAD